MTDPEEAVEAALGGLVALGVGIIVLAALTLAALGYGALVGLWTLTPMTGVAVLLVLAAGFLLAGTAGVFLR